MILAKKGVDALLKVAKRYRFHTPKLLTINLKMKTLLALVLLVSVSARGQNLAIRPALPTSPTGRLYTYTVDLVLPGNVVPDSVRVAIYPHPTGRVPLKQSRATLAGGTQWTYVLPAAQNNLPAPATYLLTVTAFLPGGGTYQYGHYKPFIPLY